MKVDLPAPLGPVRPYRRPWEKATETSSNRIFEPKRIDTDWTEIMWANPLFYRDSGVRPHGRASPWYHCWSNFAACCAAC